MSLQDIENTIAKLPLDELAMSSDWFLDFDAAQFDNGVKPDARDRRLDSPADVARRDHAAERSLRSGELA